MSSIPNYKMKKTNMLGIKTKKKAIPININTNPTPGKFLFSNHVNNIASTYLSMGRKIQINKNIKTSKLIHVNTNSATNYYTLNSKETKQTNGSITNSLICNIKNNNNKSEYNSINAINYVNLNSNNNNLSQQQSSEINKINTANSKDKKQLSTISNSKINNDILINGYQSSKNNINTGKFKNKINNITATNIISKNKKTYSSRQNFLDSKIKTKKLPMKSKIRQYKFNYKNNKPISTSFNNVYTTKRHFKGNNQKDIINYVRSDLLNNNEKNYGNYFTKNNFINHKNLFENKNKHNRHNTASFGNKEILNIFHKKNLSTKINNIYNNINIINENNDRNTKNSVNKNNYTNETNLLVYNIINKINNSNNSKKKIKKLSNGKINDIKIYVNEKKINSKDIKNNNSNNNKKLNSLHNFYYTKYLSNNYHSNNNSNIIHHHKNISNNINLNITGIKKILVKQKETKKINQNKIVVNPIPTPSQKMKSNIIPSQRNIKINLAKFLKGVKAKPNYKNKLIVGRKSFSIKKITKENNSDFYISQLNDKISNILLKNNEDINNIQNNYTNNNTNINTNINKIINEEYIQNKEKIENKDNNKDDNNKFDDNDNVNDNDNDNIDDDNKIDGNDNIDDNNKIDLNIKSNIDKDLIKENILHKNNKNINNKYYYDVNCNSNNSTTNNINNKNDYSIDNIPGPININNKITLKTKKSIDNELQNITDLNNSNPNNNKNKNIEEKNKEENEIIKIKIEKNEKKPINNDTNKIKIIINNQKNEKLINNNIKNNLFDEDNLDDLPEDYDENFNDLYSIINRINFGSVLVCVEGLFTPEGRTYKRYREKFDKFYDKLFIKKGNSFSNSNNKPKKIVEVAGLTSNTKTNSSSSKKAIVSPNIMYNDLNIVKELNVI